jgi:hypothetical protein
MCPLATAMLLNCPDKKILYARQCVIYTSPAFLWSNTLPRSYWPKNKLATQLRIYIVPPIWVGQISRVRVKDGNEHRLLAYPRAQTL